MTNEFQQSIHISSIHKFSLLFAATIFLQNLKPKTWRRKMSLTFYLSHNAKRGFYNKHWFLSKTQLLFYVFIKGGQPNNNETMTADLNTRQLHVYLSHLNPFQTRRLQKRWWGFGERGGNLQMHGFEDLKKKGIGMTYGLFQVSVFQVLVGFPCMHGWLMY